MTQPASALTLPDDLADRVIEIAVRQERSADSIVEEALALWLDREGRRHRLTVEALASVDAGRVVEHAAVERWLDSLETDQPLPLPQP
jgi:predicted transcriptional regulator